MYFCKSSTLGLGIKHCELSHISIHFLDSSPPLFLNKIDNYLFVFVCVLFPFLHTYIYIIIQHAHNQTHRFVESRPTFTYRENAIQIPRNVTTGSSADSALWFRFKNFCLWGGELSSRLFGVWHGSCLFWTRTLTGWWFQLCWIFIPKFREMIKFD